ncbi:MBL fold metallo-hydrolase [Pontiella agarivorans]|uniref:hydroxyacylglutathione hydrolase n=1 Tax=Pontiella agarivorans TaxID=3038953 RepID=A0ABU5MWU5_9BACT|nr:MBL fold metallo-hydrolase [Pontiella agarivorans]MDZ8118650.1 MBL fold metallo-hydrolase [Pontiella agarivorans]
MIRATYSIGAYKLIVVQVLLSSYETFNYLLCRDGLAILIDCGEAAPVFQVLEKENLQLTDILITHNHGDHVGGCRAVQDRLGVLSVSPGVESRTFEILGTPCRSFATPGHLDICKSYCFPDLGIIFVGDTIIGGAVGRMMDGAAEPFFQSLEKIKQLPDETIVFGGHDYLEENAAFALSVNPENDAMRERLELYEAEPLAAVFQTLENEKKSNPFLQAESAEEFAELRLKKDRFG